MSRVPRGAADAGAAGTVARAAGGGTGTAPVSAAGAVEASDGAQASTLAALRELLAEGVGALSVCDATAVLTRVSRRVLDTQHAVAYLADGAGRIGEIITVGVEPHMAATLHRLLMGRDGDQVPLWRRRLHGEAHPVLVVDDAHASDLIPREIVDAISLRSYIAFPVLAAGGDVLGGVVCSHADRVRHWREDERDAVRQLALEGSLIIENAALREADERRLAAVTEQALTDPLTGLANRTRLFDRIEQAAAAGSGTDHVVGVVFIDIDDFKHVNDMYGHAAGDRVLVTVADQLRGCVRDEDTVARFAGDEFVVLLHQTTEAEAHAAAQRIAGRLTPLRVRLTEGHATERVVTLELTASIGIAVMDGGSLPPEVLVRQADQAMYRAKRTGHAVAAFHASTDGPTLARDQLERELRTGIQRNELRLVYQPILDLEAEQIAGVEALVRWEHPRLGLLPPGRFLPMAEETGLIVPLGRWVLDAACRQLAAWDAARLGSPPVTMSVNVSARQLRRGDAYIRELTDVLEATGVDPARLVLEITETALLPDLEAPALLGRIRDAGVRSALDDFGIGYSSLRSLQRLPIEIIKIDRSFVGAMLQDPGSKVLVSAMTALGATLGLRVIAEGIETPEQLEMLRGLACPFGQGYLFARPMPAEAVAALLTTVTSEA